MLNTVPPSLPTDTEQKLPTLPFSPPEIGGSYPLHPSIQASQDLLPAWRQEAQGDDPGVPHSQMVAEPSLDTEITFPRWRSTICSRGDHPDFESCTLPKVTPASNPQMALRIKFKLHIPPGSSSGAGPRGLRPHPQYPLRLPHLLSRPQHTSIHGPLHGQFHLCECPSSGFP